MQRSEEIAIIELEQPPHFEDLQKPFLPRKRKLDAEEEVCFTAAETERTKKERTGEDIAMSCGSSSTSGWERLKQHWVEVAGQVWIPDIWGQEGCLKDWIDGTAFDAPLAGSRIMSARAALAEEGRRAMASNSNRLMRIVNGC